MENISREVYEKLKKKYDFDAYWYIEYPHKRFWSERYTEEDLKTGLKTLLSSGAAVLFYAHMPYCHTQCYFCTCRVEISLDYENVKHYLNVLYREIDLYRDVFEKIGLEPNIREFHMGGGSPTYIREPEFNQFMEKIKPLIPSLNDLDEFAIEIDPRRVKQDRLKFYSDKGINRISFGIQDFDPDVMKAVNRVQPSSIIENLLTTDIRRRFKSVNFDILCGLPRQTKESFKRTIEKVIELSPDRIALFFFEFSPKYAKHMLQMPLHEIPGAYEKKELFLLAMDLLLKNGYIRTGYDMFAKPTDDVAKAKEKRKMRWNSFGSTPGRCVDILALGVHSYSRLGPTHYSQNVYELPRYEKLLTEGRFPIFRGYRLNQDDVIRRDVITQLRVYFNVEYADIEEKYSIDFKKYFAEELCLLKEFIDDGMVKVTEAGIEITQLGKLFTNIICSNFDIYVQKERQALKTV